MKSFTKQLKTTWWRVKSEWTRYRYGNPAEKLKIVGVTGTNGKTTTATLLYRISMELGHKVGLIGTVENLVNGKKLELESGAPMPGTTPDSVTLTKIFSKMVEAGCEYVFMEVSSHALDQRRVVGINFTGGIFTNLTHDHLDYHKSLENYFDAKKKFFQMLPAGAFALSNADDEYGRKMLEEIEARKFLYGFNDTPDFKGEISKLDFSGLDLEIKEKNVATVRHVHSKLLGRFNAYNIISVWGALKLLGFDMVEVDNVLENIEPPRGRFEHFTSKTGVLVVVDYAHTPDALEKIFLAVREVGMGQSKENRVISVFGCGGDRDPAKRSIMGKIGAANSDVAIFTSDNPRNEEPEMIIAQMKIGLSPQDFKKVTSLPDRHEAIKEAVKIAKSGDVILCAGKGHEDYQEIKGVKTHFDDMEEFKKAYGEI